MLIGQQYAALHPTRVKSSGHLLLMENEFGYVIAGTYPMMKTDAEVSGSFLTVREAAVMHAVEECTSTDFFEIEGLGVTCQPKCGGCKCGTCHPGGKPMSLLEEKELEDQFVLSRKLKGKLSGLKNFQLHQSLKDHM